MNTGNSAIPPDSKHLGLLDVAGQGLRQVGECIQARLDLAVIEAQAAGRRFLVAGLWSMAGIAAASVAFLALQFCIFLTLVDVIEVPRVVAAWAVFVFDAAIALCSTYQLRRHARAIGLPQTRRALTGETNA